MSLTIGKPLFLAINNLLLLQDIIFKQKSVYIFLGRFIVHFRFLNATLANSMPLLRNCQCVITYLSTIFVVPLFRNDGVSQLL